MSSSQLSIEMAKAIREVNTSKSWLIKSINAADFETAKEQILELQHHNAALCHVAYTALKQVEFLEEKAKQQEGQQPVVKAQTSGQGDGAGVLKVKATPKPGFGKGPNQGKQSSSGQSSSSNAPY